MFDTEMRYLSVSRRWLADYGLGDSNVHGLSHYEVFPEVSDQWKSVHRRGLAGEVLREDADSFVRADGSVQWLSWDVRPWYDTRGEVGGIVIFTVDITERKQAEAALREKDERLRRVTESMKEGLVIATLDEQKLSWNQAAIEMHGFSDPEEWQKSLPELKNIFEISTPDGEVIPYELWPMPRILRGDEVSDLEVRIRRKDAEWERVFSYGGSLITDDGGQQVAFVTINDVTKRSRAEDEIRKLNAELEERVIARTAELVAANKELESFSYSVSHDLRAPLRAVDGFSKAVLEDYGPSLPEEGKQDLETICRNAHRMSDLIDDLLAFSRLGRQQMTKLPVNTRDLVGQCLEELTSMYEGRVVEFSIGELPPCLGDRALLKQVWINLLSNSIKFTGNQPNAAVQVGAQIESGGVVYFVKDNGAGFDMKYANKLFGVFQRLHRADEFEGTGVGLAIVQRIIHRHGAQVWGDAALNQGATFYFTVAEKGVAPL